MASWLDWCRDGVFCAGLLLATAAVCAQGNSAALPSPAVVADACKRDVLKYQAQIEFVRKSLGDKEAEALAARFMVKEEWDAVLLAEGYCGLAKRLRARKLVQ